MQGTLWSHPHPGLLWSYIVAKSTNDSDLKVSNKKININSEYIIGMYFAFFRNREIRATRRTEFHILSLA
jgi:hypothetical protein